VVQPPEVSQHRENAINEFTGFAQPSPAADTREEARTVG